MVYTLYHFLGKMQQKFQHEEMPMVTEFADDAEGATGGITVAAIVSQVSRQR